MILIFQRGSLGFWLVIFARKGKFFYNNMHWKILKRDFENETSIEPNLCPKAYDFLRMSLTCTIFVHHTNFEYFKWRPWWFERNRCIYENYNNYLFIAQFLQWQLDIDTSTDLYFSILLENKYVLIYCMIYSRKMNMSHEI